MSKSSKPPRDKSRRVIGYMCLVDWDHEIGAAMDGVKIYADVDDLRKNRPCVEECGIIEVEVRARQVVKGPNYGV